MLMKFLKLLLPAAVCLTLMGCGSSRTVVLEPVQQRCAKTITIQVAPHTVPVPAEVSTAFEKALSKKLYAKNGFAAGDEVILRYRFLQLNEGSRLKRYLTGGIGNCGEGTLTIEATYLDSKGNILGKSQTEGKIGSGVFGGSYDDAVEKAAEEISRYSHQAFIH